MKTDDAFWVQLRTILAEMERVKPTLAPPPGRLGWLKRLILQLTRPLGVPQMDFNKQLSQALAQLATSSESISRRMDMLETSVKDLDAAFEKLSANLNSIVHSASRGAAAQQQQPAATDEAPPPRPRTLLEAVERGFYLQNICPGAFNVLDEIEDWDVLMILDACRFDAFERIWEQFPPGTLPGKLAKRISLGSHTATWLKRTFRERDSEAGKIVYLATNPHISGKYLARMGIDAQFAHVEELFTTCWDARERTVMPQRMAEEYLRLRERFPGKKFILHFLQPHSPYVGKTRIRTGQRPDMPSPVNADGVPLTAPTDLALIEDCQVSLADGLKAYDDNLRLALEVIIGLLPSIPGRVAITADHGELFGEYGVFGHVEEMYVPELIEVPYLAVTKQT